ncbi:MAG: helix-turn-helix domain-containing protein [Dehalococcoidia bacterium]|nr:helix-turn-helix domain-containing protein [Dehalococcoidia bacterium]
MDTTPAHDLDPLPALDSQVVGRRPAPALRDLVTGYQGYVESVSSVLVRRTFPGPNVVLIIGFGAPIRVADPGRPGAPASDHISFVAGPHTQHGFYQFAGVSCGVQVDLTPIGAYLFFGVRMDGLTDRVLRLDDIVPGGASGLSAWLQELPAWDARFDLLDAFFCERLARVRPAAHAVTWAWRAMIGSHGNVSIGALAAEVGWSRKHLAARFHEQIGLSPKTAASLLRFNRALDLLQRPTHPGGAQLALLCGYYDQTHLAREFRRLSGLTISEFLRAPAALNNLPSEAPAPTIALSP